MNTHRDSGPRRRSIKFWRKPEPEPTPEPIPEVKPEPAPYISSTYLDLTAAMDILKRAYSGCAHEQYELWKWCYSTPPSSLLNDAELYLREQAGIVLRGDDIVRGWKTKEEKKALE